ncbi:carbonic anhydrase [Persephonella sp.]|uniref:carbonic anhydrase n=1 Tax=Persephonella sp. TaxID=2060922 RepID=UPI002612E68D|nr:carbonic anhydrase [Persephonella sp.]
MKRVLSVAAISAFVFGCGVHHSSQHWGYTGKYGPEHWGSMSTRYIMCKIGKNQSPIDIKDPIRASLKDVKINYSSGSKTILNNGHTIEVTYTSGGYMTIDSKKFHLKQFHFHSPSEHTLRGKHFPMEIHFVHKDRQGNLAVIGVFVKEGRENPTIKKLWQKMPTKPGMENRIVNINPSTLLPQHRSYFRYSGSLTTPPCSEGVRWIVMETPIEMSKSQIEKFQKVMGVNNNRPVQPINARLIIEKK